MKQLKSKEGKPLKRTYLFGEDPDYNWVDVDMSTECYLYIEGTNKEYKASNYGNIQRKELQPNGDYKWVDVPFKKNRDDYFCAYIQGKGSIGVQRIIMTTFKPIPEGTKYEVDHIDGDKSNNRLDNLEWVTHKENMQRGIKNNLCKSFGKRREVVVFDLEGNFVNYFRSVTQACQQYGSVGGNWVVKCCRKKIPHYKGHVFRYKEDVPYDILKKHKLISQKLF